MVYLHLKFTLYDYDCNTNVFVMISWVAFEKSQFLRINVRQILPPFYRPQT